MLTGSRNPHISVAMTSMSLALRALTLGALVVSTFGGPVRAQSDPDVMTRMDQIESSLRLLTGQIEQLQYRNQQLEQQLHALQDAGGRAPPGPQMARPPTAPVVAPAGPVETPIAQPGRRSDAFDPNQSPTAPGAPRPLGAVAAPPATGTLASSDNVGVPGGRSPGAPLDLSTMAARSATDSSLAPPPAGSQVAAVAPPTQTPKDAFDLGYGYMLRRDYALADDTFRDFLTKYPSDRLAADAQYWLGESLFQRQNYRDAANAFLDMSKKYESHGKAPEALLRLGQSLAALNEKELACATFGEVGRKYPRAAATVKQTVEREQKRVHC